MNLQPKLEGELLALRQLLQTDFDELFKAASDPDIWTQHPQPDRYKPDVFLTFFKEAIESQGALAVVDQRTSQIIGTSRFYDYSQDSSSVVVGYTFLAKQYWGGVYNWELKKLMVNYALQIVRTVYFHVGVGNLRSQRALQKIGGINIGIQNIPVSYAPPKKSFVYRIERPLI